MTKILGSYIYIALGIDMNGKKDVLGMCVEENESAKFFNRQLRKVTKSKMVFPSDDSLLKMLYLATMDITKKWTGHRQDWGQIHSQPEIYFEERLSGRNL